jgi:hypothetical protein
VGVGNSKEVAVAVGGGTVGEGVAGEEVQAARKIENKNIVEYLFIYFAVAIC